MKGVTDTGFAFEIDSEALNDMEVVEDLVALSKKEDATVLPNILNKLLGAEQKKALYDHCRTESGRVPVDKVEEELAKIFDAAVDENDDVKK